MKSFLAAGLSFLPFIGFWLLTGQGMPGTGLMFGLITGAAVLVWRAGARDIKLLDILAADFFAVLALAYVMNWGWMLAHAGVASFAVLAVVSFASVALGRPWSADYSRAQFGELAHTPRFVGINVAMTALWGVAFLLCAVAAELQFDGRIALAAACAGLAGTIAGQIFMARMTMQARQTRQEAPAVAPARARSRPHAANLGPLSAG
jgi:all-trans-retinol 13,14-reductase